MKIRQYDPSRHVAGEAEHTNGSYGVGVFVRVGVGESYR
jgi:hypothetical protein